MELCHFNLIVTLCIAYEFFYLSKLNKLFLEVAWPEKKIQHLQTINTHVGTSCVGFRIVTSPSKNGGLSQSVTGSATPRLPVAASVSLLHSFVSNVRSIVRLRSNSLSYYCPSMHLISVALSSNDLTVQLPHARPASIASTYHLIVTHSFSQLLSTATHHISK